MQLIPAYKRDELMPSVARLNPSVSDRLLLRLHGGMLIQNRRGLTKLLPEMTLHGRTASDSAR